MSDLLTVRRGVYHDSVKLMLVSRTASAVDGVRDAAVVMATPLNLELLAARGFDLGDTPGVTPNDIVIAVRADDAAACERALSLAESELAGRPAPGVAADRPTAPVSLRSAARADPDLNVALVSVPAAHAAYESAIALESGLHVMCFSSGVTVEQEVALKRRAAELDRLFMGPDCGTAIIDGVGLGFANEVRRGPVGIVGASGTGIQEVCCLLDAADVGVSHAIGVGGRDLSGPIGGSMFRRGLELLARDRGTEVILGLSKLADPTVAGDVLACASGLGKPVVIALVGLESAMAGTATVDVVSGLEAGATRGAELVGRRIPLEDLGEPTPGQGQGEIRGLYGGGTLCVEAMSIVCGVVGRVGSNVPLQPGWEITDLDHVRGHAFIDLGAEQLTDGRAHPMIDSTLRLEHFTRHASDPAVAVILLDVVLGYGAAPDPAGELAPTISGARAERPELTVIVSVCGTRRDPQGLEDQRTRLRRAGAVVTRSAAGAARAALAACGYEAVQHGDR